MADLEFFFDPVCPWAWITSRWVVEVRDQRHYTVDWRFISLKMINEGQDQESYGDERRAVHMAGLYTHRVCDEVRLQHGNDAVGALYTAIGTAFHPEGRRPEITGEPVAFMAEMLSAAGLPDGLAAHALDDSHDAYVRQDTEVALGRTGRDLGTPIITFHPGTDKEASFFGPVIAHIPRGEDATKLWDAVEIIATTSGMAELKRSLRARPHYD